MKTKRIFQNRMRSAQSTLEFTALVMIVLGALILGQVYFKRGVQGRWKAAVDDLADELYDPFLTCSDITYRTSGNTVVEITTFEGSGGLWTLRQDYSNTTDTRSGKTVVGGYN